MSTTFFKKACLALGSVTSLSLLSIVGFAQQVDPTVEREAQALLESAVELMARKQFPAACRKLELVLEKLPQATGARLELAHCYRGEGRMASAWRQFTEVEKMAHIAGQTDRVAEARKNAAELAKIVGKLQFEVPPEVSAINGVTITLDGEAQAPDSWGKPVPVDAMEHLITATAPGYEPWTTRVHVTNNSRAGSSATPILVKVGSPSLPGTSLQLDVSVEITRIPGLSIKLDSSSVYLSEWSNGGFIDAGSHEIHISAPGYEPWTTTIVVRQGERVVLTIPMLKKHPAVPPDDRELKSPVIPPKSTRFDTRIAGIAGIALGGATLGTAAILGGVAISRNQASNNGHCDANDFCDSTGYPLRSQALAIANGSTAVFIVGGVILASGIVLIAISPKPTVSTVHHPAATTAIWIGPTSIGLGSSW